MGKIRNRQRGAIMIMTAVSIVVMIGIAALALDLGRLFVLHTEMQNAADAAALAAAKELDGKPGARDRAMAAARGILSHQAHFAENPELLGTALPATVDTNPAVAGFVFYCAIGSKYDVAGACEGGTVDTTYTDTNHILPRGNSESALDADTHYVKVKLLPQGSQDQHYVIDLIFLPVLSLLSDDVPTTAATHAQATAGRHFFACNTPPMVLCDPFEGSGTTFREAMVPGQQIKMKQRGSSGHGEDDEHGHGSSAWAPGDFGFLRPPDGETIQEYIAKEYRDPQVCVDHVGTETGVDEGKTTAGINTRFDQYENPGFKNVSSNDYPPAEDIINYPNDLHWNAVHGDNRFGTGEWPIGDYWSAFHGGSLPGELAGGSRYDVYKYEIEHNLPPCLADTGNCTEATKGDPFKDGRYKTSHTAQSDPDRRVLYVTVLSCIRLQDAGLMKPGHNDYIPVTEPDGYAKMFLTKCVSDSARCDVPSGSDNPFHFDDDGTIYGEYIGWAGEGDANYHVDIQLYE